MTQAAIWIQYLTLLMWFTDTKESVPTIDNPHDAIILSKPLPSISEPQRRIDFSKWRDPNKQNISQGQIYQEISIETPLTTYILPDHFHQHIFGQDSTAVMSFQQSPCCGTVSNVCTGASVKGRIAEMSDFLVWWLVWEWYRANAVQTLVVLAVLSHATSSHIPFL